VALQLRGAWNAGEGPREPIMDRYGCDRERTDLAVELRHVEVLAGGAPEQRGELEPAFAGPVREHSDEIRRHDMQARPSVTLRAERPGERGGLRARVRRPVTRARRGRA